MELSLLGRLRTWTQSLYEEGSLCLVKVISSPMRGLRVQRCLSCVHTTWVQYPEHMWKEKNDFIRWLWPSHKHCVTCASPTLTCTHTQQQQLAKVVQWLVGILGTTKCLTFSCWPHQCYISLYAGNKHKWQARRQTGTLEQARVNPSKIPDGNLKMKVFRKVFLLKSVSIEKLIFNTNLYTSLTLALLD